jgi:hypothetical protein
MSKIVFTSRARNDSTKVKTLLASVLRRLKYISAHRPRTHLHGVTVTKFHSEYSVWDSWILEIRSWNRNNDMRYLYVGVLKSHEAIQYRHCNLLSKTQWNSVLVVVKLVFHFKRPQRNKSGPVVQLCTLVIVHDNMRTFYVVFVTDPITENARGFIVVCVKQSNKLTENLV